MNRRWTFTSAVIVAAASIVAVPVGAQDRHEHGGGRPAASQPAPRQAPPQAQARQSAPPQAQARQSAPRPSESRPYSPPPQAVPRSNESRSHSMPQAIPRYSESRPLPTAPPVSRAYENRSYGAPQAVPRAEVNRQFSGQPPRANENRREYNGQQAVPRSYGAPGYQTPAPRSDSRGYGDPRGSYAQPRDGYAQPRDGHRSPGYGAPRSPAYGPSYGDRSHYARPYHSQAYVRPHNYVPYRPFPFNHAYYSFRPFWNLGFGFWAGYPVEYPYGYLGAYTPRVYGYDYYSDGSYTMTGSVPVYGGVSFDIKPSDADLFIDGEYVGTVGMFGPYSEPLTLTPGEHRIAIQRDGYRPMEWDVTIEPGQVIPYRGSMERY